MRNSHVLAALAALTLSSFAYAAGTNDGKGEALQRKKTLRFDGRNVEAVGGGRFNSFTHMNEGDGGKKQKKLYELPRNFSNRIAEEADELRYRK